MLLRVFLFFFFTSTAFALEVNVTSRRVQYLLTIDEKDNVTLKGRLENLSLARQKCNENVLAQFRRNIDKTLTSGTVFKAKESRDMTIVRDNQTYYEFSKSRLGAFLENLPKEIQRLKIESSFRCKPGKS